MWLVKLLDRGMDLLVGGVKHLQRKLLGPPLGEDHLLMLHLLQEPLNVLVLVIHVFDV